MTTHAYYVIKGKAACVPDDTPAVDRGVGSHDGPVVGEGVVTCPKCIHLLAKWTLNWKVEEEKRIAREKKAAESEKWLEGHRTEMAALKKRLSDYKPPRFIEAEVDGVKYTLLETGNSWSTGLVGVYGKSDSHWLGNVTLEKLKKDVEWLKKKRAEPGYREGVHENNLKLYDAVFAAQCTVLRLIEEVTK